MIWVGSLKESGHNSGLKITKLLLLPQLKILLPQALEFFLVISLLLSMEYQLKNGHSNKPYQKFVEKVEQQKNSHFCVAVNLYQWLSSEVKSRFQQLSFLIRIRLQF